MKKLILILLLFSSILSANLFSQPISFERTSPAIVRVTTGDSLGQVLSYGVVRALNINSVDTLNITLSNDNRPAGWSPYGMCTWENCFAESLYVLPTQHISQGSVDTVDVFVNPYNFLGSGSIRVTISYHGTFSVFQDFGFAVDPIGIKQISTIVKEFSLGQNYPNPFNPNTKINFTIPKAEYTYLRIYDILGREVKTLVNGQLNAGEYQVDFDAKELASGMYYYSLRAGENVTVKKMVLVK